MNEPEPDAPVSDPAWQTPQLVPLLDTNNDAANSTAVPLEASVISAVS